MRNKKVSFRAAFFSASFLFVFALFFYLELVPVLGKAETTELLVEQIPCTEVCIYGGGTQTSQGSSLTEQLLYSAQNIRYLSCETISGDKFVRNIDGYSYDIIRTGEGEKVERWNVATTYRLGLIKKTKKYDYYKIYLNREGFDE